MKNCILNCFDFVVLSQIDARKIVLLLMRISNFSIDDALNTTEEDEKKLLECAIEIEKEFKH